MMKVCQKCGKNFKTYRSKRKFCSHICAMKAPWNTINKRGINNVSKRPEVRKKMSITRIKNNMIKDKAWNWKGNQASYVAIHMWIKSHWGRPNHCDFCGKKEKRRYEWANISGKYNRQNKEDWFQLCVPCHRKYDMFRAKF